ncbi:Hpt domain-containing protein [Rhodobium gokarnense]|uniref:Chemotaxis protein histidine kinase CheA n=1 Tax=Rhodobium gokarnense TaxID=364296 RepID=A0ABT3HDK6_9HYPH|nr:Hpt domain-containing protein [Rhodobium gokarnense]MCW2308470.1 chemotaxis protein histidine kinase CheA [Rhodobium gokarnense]
MANAPGVKIQNPVNLNRKVPDLPRGSAFDPVSRAEQALGKLSKTFEYWMTDEISRLNRVWKTISADDGMDKTTYEQLYSVSHDLKGEAATFGYPLIGDIADSLCLLLDDFARDPGSAPLPFVEQHVYAIKAIVKEKVQNAEDPVGRQLVAELRKLGGERAARFAGKSR